MHASLVVMHIMHSDMHETSFVMISAAARLWCAVLLAGSRRLFCGVCCCLQRCSAQLIVKIKLHAVLPARSILLVPFCAK